jgi:hypothetical protein
MNYVHAQLSGIRDRRILIGGGRNAVVLNERKANARFKFLRLAFTISRQNH